MLPSDEWFAQSQSGATAGYEAQWVLRLPSRRAARWWHTLTRIRRQRRRQKLLKLLRGTETLTVDGIDLVNANDQASIDTLNAGLFPTVANQSAQLHGAGCGVTDYPLDLR